MKNKLFYFLIFLLISAFGFQDNPAGGWYQQYLPNLNGRALTDITFLDSLIGIAVTNGNSTNDGYILKTTNGGDEWVIKYSQNVLFNKVQFVNSTTGFVNAYVNLLFKTTNAGENWFTINLPPDLFSNDMNVLSEDSIWFAQSEPLTGGLFRTTNGGVNWQRQYYDFGGNPDKIYMFDGSLGFMSASGLLFRTTNGGVNWTNVPGAVDFKEMEFIDSLTGWMCDGFIFKTTNGGVNWDQQQLPPKGGNILLSRINSFKAINKDTLWGVGGILMIDSSFFRGTIYKSTNGGDTWGFQTADTSISISQYYFIDFINKNVGWSYSNYGGVHTISGGCDTTFYTSINSTGSTVPENFTLYQNYPNPFNPKTNITYSLKTANYILIKVFDINGRSVKELVNQRQNPGSYKVDFDGAGLSSGVYFYRIEVIDERTSKIFSDTKKMILTK